MEKEEIDRLDRLAAACFPVVYWYTSRTIEELSDPQAQQGFRRRVAEQTVKCALLLRDALDRAEAGEC